MPGKINRKKTGNSIGTAFKINSGEAWAITPSALRGLISIVLNNQASNFIDDENDNDNEDILKDYNEYGFAEISVTGPIMRYPGIFSRLFGGTSVEGIMNALDIAGAKDDIRGVMLNINSPGGMVDGINELAGKIWDFKKPVVAYVGGEANSAAYWLASAADSIVVNDTAAVGSIGVYTSYLDSRSAMKEAGYDQYDIVASQSPRKVPDPALDEGRAQIQAHIDKLAEIFINTVAENRGTTIDDVTGNYGQGDTVIGHEAVSRGMADETGNYEDAKERLRQSIKPNKSTGLIFGTNFGKNGGNKMTREQLIAEFPDIAKALMEDGAIAERDRIKGIEAIYAADPEAFEASGALKEAKWDGKTTPEAAAALILKAIAERKEAEKSKIEALKAARAQDAGLIPNIPQENTSDDRQAFEDAVGKMKVAARKASVSRRNRFPGKGGKNE